MPASRAATGEPPAASRVSAWLRLAVFAVLLAAGAVVVLAAGPRRLFTEDVLGPPGAAALLLFTSGYAACSVLMVPRPVMGVAGGALFGATAGAVAGLVGTLLGAAAAFALGRRYARQALRPLVRGRWAAAADRQLSVRGFRAVLMLRLLAVVPFAAVNHAAAVSRTPWREFLGATALGCTPGVVAAAVAGSRATEPLSPAFVSALALLVLSGPVAVTLWRRRTAPAVHDPPDAHGPPAGLPAGRPVTSDLRIDR